MGVLQQGFVVLVDSDQIAAAAAAIQAGLDSVGCVAEIYHWPDDVLMIDRLDPSDGVISIAGPRIAGPICL